MLYLYRWQCHYMYHLRCRCFSDVTWVTFLHLASHLTFKCFLKRYDSIIMLLQTKFGTSKGNKNWSKMWVVQEIGIELYCLTEGFCFELLGSFKKSSVWEILISRYPKLCSFKKYPHLSLGSDFVLRPLNPQEITIKLYICSFNDFIGLTESPHPTGRKYQALLCGEGGGGGGGVLIFSGTRIWENLSNSTVTVAQITDSCKSCNSDLVHFCVKIYRDLFWISPLIIV